MKARFLCLLLLGTPLPAQNPPAAKEPSTFARDGTAAPTREVTWHDVTKWGAEGRAWVDQPRVSWFDRLPAAAQKTVTARVWELSRDSSGMMVRFRTDATAISVHYKLTKANLAQPQMPATGVSGVDLYARNSAGAWGWVLAVKPTAQEIRTEIIKDLAPGLREYALYLPLYNGIELLEIGVPPGAQFEGLAPRPQKPLVFYGTSITHGSSASRPGMVHTAQLGRRLDLPVINLGFSGNGKMDAAVGDFLAQIDAAVYVIDCLPNMTPAEVTAKCAPLVKQLRAARPGTPIVLVEDRRHTNSWIMPARAKFHDENHAALHAVYDGLQKEGIEGLFYIPGDHLYGDDTEEATDASHASDLGFFRQSDAMEPILRAALRR